MPDRPTYDQLAHVDRVVVCGLLDQHGSAAWDGSYEHSWERHRETWKAVRVALNTAATTARKAPPATNAPAWLAPLVRERISLLGSRWQQGGGFGEIRLLERLGLVTLESDDAYVLALIGGLGDRRNTLSRADQLRTDPGLLERLWRVFEVEGGGEISLANIDKYSQHAASWQATFSELLADGTLERNHVLTCCLEALQRDFSSYRAGWFSSLHTNLAPTPDELAEHQDAYRNLLRSDVTATVTLAARCLKQINAVGKLDDEEFEALRPGLHARTKGAALDTLRLLGEIAARHPNHRPAVAALANDALEHPQADVQRTAVALLTKLGATEDIATDSLAPTVQRSLGRKASGLPADAPSPSPLHLLPESVTDGDLVERTAGLLEDAIDPLEVELVLAALASLHDPTRLHPLAKRARTVLQRGPREGVTPGWLRGYLARLILFAAGENPGPLPSAHPRAEFLVRRLGPVESVLSGRVAPTILLATPTLPGGYLDPSVLIARVAALTAVPPVEDLIAALLRLGTDGRAEALRQVAGNNATHLALRHALGAPPAEPGRFRRHPSLGGPAVWVAAARVREPGADDQLLLQAGLDRAGQGRTVRATLASNARPYSWSDRRGQHHGQHWTFTIDAPHAAATADPQQPTVAITDDPERRFGHDLEDWVPWILATTPHDVEAALTELIQPVLRGMTGNEVEHDATRVLAAMAGHPGRLGPLGVATLAAGLACHRSDHRVLAVDAVLTQIESGGINAPSLAAGMRPLAPAAPLARWASSLASLAQARQDGYVTDVLTQILPAVAGDQHGLHALVELLLEESVRLGRPVGDTPLKVWLTELPGEGKPRRAARTLLAISDSVP